MLSFFTKNQFLSVVILLLAVFGLWNIYLYLQLRKIQSKLKAFFKGAKAADLETVLFKEVKELEQTKKETRQLLRMLKALAKITEKSIQKVGLVRYNPFKETGGDQSFVIALLDASDDGLVISSLFAREGTRIYSKPIKEGKSEYPLSREEQKALKQAGVGK